MAGLTAGAMMAPYYVTKHGVVALSETLHNDLAMAGSKIGVSVLCPGWVNTRIGESSRNRPGGALPAPPADDPRAKMFRQMLESGMAPREVGRHVLEAVRERRFYVLTHPEMLPGVQARMQGILDGSNPPPPAFRALQPK
jgi:short-subunit dehydrogenase